MEQAGKRRQFDAAFKAEAVRMVTEGGYSQAEAARQLGIEAKRISHWMKQMRQHGSQERAFPGHGHEHDAELARLRREVATLRMERDLLKKVALIFAEPAKATRR
jgi:transposase